VPSYAGISGADMGYLEGDKLRFKTRKPRVVFNTALGSVATDGVLVPCRTVAVRDIVDGTSNTIAVGEQSDWGSLGGDRMDLRSSAYVGGFLGTGLAGLLEVGTWDNVLTPVPSRWQNSSYWQATSAALTTVRWPLNFKNIPSPIPGHQWNFASVA